MFQVRIGEIAFGVINSMLKTSGRELWRAEKFGSCHECVLNGDVNFLGRKYTIFISLQSERNKQANTE